MPTFRKLLSGDIRLGEPLRYSVYDEHGTLLLRAGFVVTMPAQLDRLVDKGCFVDLAQVEEANKFGTRTHLPVAVAVEAPPPTFSLADILCTGLKSLYLQLLRIPEQTDATTVAGDIAKSIQRAGARDASGLIAALHIESNVPYLIGQQMMGAVLVDRVGSLSGVGNEERISLISAALTRDLGMVELQLELDKITGPLPDAVMARVRGHPEKAITILKKAGVRDPVWLEAIHQHHERIDGSGYPRGLGAEQFDKGARLLSICDMFSAMIKPRPYRQQGKARLAQSALREIFTMGGKMLDPMYAALLVKVVGVVPPGSLVKLKSGEIAIVKDPVSNPKAATVYAIYSKHQLPMMEPVARDTSHPENEIVGMALHSECRSAQLIMKRIWMKG